MSPICDALTAQRALIEARRAETIAELLSRAVECGMCGEGPSDGEDLRAYIRDDLTIAAPLPELLCFHCFAARDDENDFTDAPLIWRALGHVVPA